MTDNTPQKKQPQGPIRAPGIPPGVTPMVADLMSAEMMATDEHMQERLQWIENEIAELTTRAGLLKRVNSLRATRAGILAANALNDIMSKGRPIPKIDKPKA